MDSTEIGARFADLTTAYLADGCIRAGVEVRCGPAGLRSVLAGGRLAGRAAPARHAGSVDIFLEALEAIAAGDVLVVDNDGRLDEACVGDLIVLEAAAAAAAGLVIWGLHRDTADIRAIGLPVFSLGSIPTGPLRLDPRPDDALASARVGDWTVGPDDLVFGDQDGVLFLRAEHATTVLSIAERIRDTERGQANRMRDGETLRRQLSFGDYLARRESNPSLTFREHLRSVGGAIEE
jgi:regulator of RNase E activity RraA